MRIEELVKKSYEKTALKYVRTFSKNPNYKLVLDRIIRKIPRGSNVLDAGCGAGVPVSRYLSKRFNVVGIDISSKMLSLARKNVPGAEFKKMSMTDIEFAPNSFSLICSFFALFHVSREEIPEVLKKFHELLKDNGYLVLSLGELKEEKEHVSSFLGEKMYFTATTRKKLIKMLKGMGFKIIYFKFLFFKYGTEKEKTEKESFIIAQKIK